MNPVLIAAASLFVLTSLLFGFVIWVRLHKQSLQPRFVEDAKKLNERREKISVTLDPRLVKHPSISRRLQTVEAVEKILIGTIPQYSDEQLMSALNIAEHGLSYLEKLLEPEMLGLVKSLPDTVQGRDAIEWLLNDPQSLSQALNRSMPYIGEMPFSGRDNLEYLLPRLEDVPSYRPSARSRRNSTFPFEDKPILDEVPNFSASSNDSADKK